jgi:hypothetical protein
MSCSADLGNSQKSGSLYNRALSCFCDRARAKRMVRSIAIGVWLRTGVSPRAELSSDTSCIWARSTMSNKWLGAGASRFSIRARTWLGPWRWWPQNVKLSKTAKGLVRLRVDEMELHRHRQWGGCWLACELYHQLELDQFFSQRLAPSRKGTRWDLILQTLVCYRLLDPGSEWRLHR